MTGWAKTKWFCPNCGVKDLWQDMNDAGDYYCGTSQYCGSCFHSTQMEIGMGSFIDNPSIVGSQAWEYNDRHAKEIIGGIEIAKGIKAPLTPEVPRVFVSPVLV